MKLKYRVEDVAEIFNAIGLRPIEDKGMFNEQLRKIDNRLKSALYHFEYIIRVY